MPPRIVRSNSFSRGRVGKKRSVTWSICSSPTGSTILALGSKVISVLIPSSTLLDLIPFTIVRTIGLVSIQSDQVAAAEEQLGAFGMGLVNDVAGALGATGIPGPASDCGWGGWFVHQFFTQVTGIASGTSTGVVDVRYSFDSRAQRKVSAEEDIVFMVENFGDTGGLRFATSFRMLIKAG